MLLRSRASLLFLSLALSAGCGREPPSRSDGSPVEVELSSYLGRLRTLPVEIGSTSRVMLLDTGGGITLITPEVARDIGCAPYGRLTAFRMNGERVDFEKCGSVEMKVGGVGLSPETVIFDLMGLLPDEVPRVDGLVCLQTFEGRALSLDLSGHRLVLETEESLKAKTAGMSELRARLDRGMGGAGLDLFVAVEGKNGLLWLELDSANLDPVLLAPHAVDELVTDAGEPLLESLLAGHPEEISIQVVGLGRTAVETRVEELIYDGALNAAFFEKALVSIDTRTGRAWATLSGKPER